MTALPTAGSTEVLYIIDLPGYVFRAFHAIEMLTSPGGEPTNATHGTVNMLTKLINERKPAYMAAALEGRTNFRDEIDPQYKAHRPPAPPELGLQMQRCKEIVAAYEIPIFEADGFEADDLIAALTKKAKAAGLFVVIASADKDLMQLVDDRCVMWDAMRDRVYGPSEVVAKFGVGPEQVRDLLALVGDSSDNVPGVPSIGVKTAAELLGQFGSIDAIYKDIDQVKKARIQKSLIDNQEAAMRSRALVTLRDDVPITFDPKALHYSGGNIEELRRVYTELGFTRQLSLLPREAPPKAQEVKAAYQLILEDAELVSYLKGVSGAGLCVSLMTTPEDAMRCALVGVALARAPGDAAYVPLAHRYLGVPKQLSEARVFELLGPLLADADIPKVGHDLKRSEVVLHRKGLALAGVRFDAMLASYLIDPEVSHELPAIAQREIALELPAIDVLLPKQRGKPQPTLEDLELDRAAPYAALVADAALRVEERMTAKLQSAGSFELLSTLELPLSSLLAELERDGVLVDSGALAKLGAFMAGELSKLEAQAREASGHDDLNVASPKQLEAMLFDELGLKSTKKTKTGRSTDAEALEAIADEHPLPNIVLEHRQIAKLKGTYVDALPRLILPATGRIHGHWRQAVAATGRISSEEPNLQNIPIRTELGKEIRRAFVAPPGCVFLSADYSQIELRVLAHLSEDPVMVEAFRKGQDIHVRTAMEIFGVDAEGVTEDMRRKSKTINFGVIYGMGEVALGKRLGIPRREAADFIEAYFERYAKVAEFMTRTMVEAKQSEKVRTLLGRVRVLPDLRSTDRMRRAYAERIAQNTPIQGTAADILKLAMVRLRTPVVAGCKMVLTVHDELDFEVPEALAKEAAQKIRAAMESVVELSVPLVVDVGYGPSWAEAH